MKFGFFGINMNACSEPDTALRVAQAAEAAGFESLWTGEHVVLPDPQVAPSPRASRSTAAGSSPRASPARAASTPS